MAAPKLGDLQTSIQVVRRDLRVPSPGSAEPRHAYAVILTTRAQVKSRTGATEFSRVDINGKQSTHTFTIRWTSLPFDVRHRVRDARGQLFQILSVENVDLGNEWMRIHCSNQGSDEVEAAR